MCGWVNKVGFLVKFGRDYPFRHHIILNMTFAIDLYKPICIKYNYVSRYDFYLYSNKSGFFPPKGMKLRVTLPFLA